MTIAAFPAEIGEWQRSQLPAGFTPYPVLGQDRVLLLPLYVFACQGAYVDGVPVGPSSLFMGGFGVVPPAEYRDEANAENGVVRFWSSNPEEALVLAAWGVGAAAQMEFALAGQPGTDLDASLGAAAEGTQVSLKARIAGPFAETGNGLCRRQFTVADGRIDGIVDQCLGAYRGMGRALLSAPSCLPTAPCDLPVFLPSVARAAVTGEPAIFTVNGPGVIAGHLEFTGPISFTMRHVPTLAKGPTA